MASDARAEKRRGSRTSQNGNSKATKAAKGQPPNPPEETPPTEIPPGTELLTNGVFLAIVRTDDGSEGIAQIIPVPQGDVRAAEMLTIAKKGAKIIAGNLGIDD